MWNDNGYNDPPPLPERQKGDERKPAETGWCVAFVLLLAAVGYGLVRMHGELEKIL